MLIRVISLATMAFITSAPVAHADPVDPAQAIAQKFSEASDGKQPAPAATPQKPSDDADYEADMLQRARAEELDRQKQDAQQIAVKPVAPVSPPAALPATQIPPPAPTIAALPEKPAPEPANSPAPSPRPAATPATVLLVLDTGGTALGFKPDPIICIDDRCWLSNGIGAPALAMPRTQAVALPTTDDSTAILAAANRLASIVAWRLIPTLASKSSRSAKAMAHHLEPILSPQTQAAAMITIRSSATKVSQRKTFGSGSCLKRPLSRAAHLLSKMQSPKAFPTPTLTRATTNSAKAACLSRQKVA